jgi:hypothetical protein
MNKQKFTDALTALETATQLHNDAVNYSQRAIEESKRAIKLFTEATEEGNEKLTVDEEKTTVKANGKYTLLDDNGLHVFSTSDSYRKYIVDLAKEEIAGFANRQTTVAFKHKEEDIEKREVNGFKTTTYATMDEKFIVNKEKRTVVCLLVGHKSKHVYARGIAKCDPIDTFNEYIGKLIAFYRAAGEEIPKIFLTVPNPKNVEDGDLVIDPCGNTTKWTIQNHREIDHEQVIADFHVLGKDTVHRKHLVSKKFFDSLKVLDDSNRK